MEASELLGRVLLVTGKEEFLAERAVAEAKGAVRAFDADAEVGDLDGGDLTASALAELTAPSLFSAIRCAVVRGIEALPDDSYDIVHDYAVAPSEDVALVLVHGGGQKGSGLLTRLRKLPTVTEVKCEELKPADLPGFVGAEVKRAGGRIDREAAMVLVGAVGNDLRALAAAVGQLAFDFPDGTLTEDKVAQYFGGRAETKLYDVVDAAFVGNRTKALEELRWALDGGEAAPRITAAFASTARTLAQLAGGLTPAGPPWAIKQRREQLRGWSEPALAQALAAVAQADADVKDVADTEYTLERLVLTIAGLRKQRG